MYSSTSQAHNLTICNNLLMFCNAVTYVDTTVKDMGRHVKGHTVLL